MQLTKDIIETFTKWTKLKIRIHISEKPVYPKIKEIWWVSLGQNVGVEVNGKNEFFERPILVVKVFNKDSSLIAPISSKINSGKNLFEFIGPSGEKNVANLSQLRTVSSKRFVRKIGEIDTATFEKIREMIKNFF